MYESLVIYRRVYIHTAKVSLKLSGKAVVSTAFNNNCTYFKYFKYMDSQTWKDLSWQEWYCVVVGRKAYGALYNRGQIPPNIHLPNRFEADCSIFWLYFLTEKCSQTELYCTLTLRCGYARLAGGCKVRLLIFYWRVELEICRQFALDTQYWQ